LTTRRATDWAALHAGQPPAWRDIEAAQILIAATETNRAAHMRSMGAGLLVTSAGFRSTLLCRTVTKECDR